MSFYEKLIFTTYDKIGGEGPRAAVYAVYKGKVLRATECAGCKMKGKGPCAAVYAVYKGKEEVLCVTGCAGCKMKGKGPCVTGCASYYKMLLA